MKQNGVSHDASVQEVTRDQGVAPPSSEELLQEALEDVLQMPAVVRPVSPHPPCCRKTELFPDESVFADIDEQVIKVGQAFVWVGSVGRFVITPSYLTCFRVMTKV